MTDPNFDRHLPEPDADLCPDDCLSHSGGECICDLLDEQFEYEVADMKAAMREDR